MRTGWPHPGALPKTSKIHQNKKFYLPVAPYCRQTLHNGWNVSPTVQSLSKPSKIILCNIYLRENRRFTNRVLGEVLRRRRGCLIKKGYLDNCYQYR